MNNFLFFLFLSFCFSQNALARFDNKVLFDYDFFQTVPHSEWVVLDSLKKSTQLSRFLDKELVFHEATSLGLQFSSENFMRLHERYNQLLVNSFYEKVVAAPFVDDAYIEKTKKFINERVYVHHLLVGFEGCSLSGNFSKTQDEALFFADSLKIVFEKDCLVCSVEEKKALFSSFASSFSNDPSVKQNKGEIGWVSWGQVMSSFQDVAFSSSVFNLSKPVLTDYGYHLIFVEKKGFSDYYYYNKNFLDAFSYKFGLQRAPIDSLRNAAAVFDSLYIDDGGLVFSDVVLNNLFSLIEKKTRVEKLRGGKKSYIDWVDGFFNEKKLFFVFKNKGFGLGWFVNSLKKTPATRVPTIRKKDDIKELVLSFLLKEGALYMGYQKNLHEDLLFKKEVLEQNKNILYRSYSDWVVSSLPAVDSLFIKNLYESGVYKGDFVKPLQAVFTEIKINNKLIVEKIYDDFLNGALFDDLVVAYGGEIKKPVFEGGSSPLASVLFSLVVGEVSKPIKNTDESFSIVRLERFIEPVPFELKHVYSQIEQKIKKEQKDSIKNNLSVGLKEKFNLNLYKEVLSF